MTAAEVSAIAESVIAVSASRAVTAWVWHTSRRAWKWRRQKQRARVQSDALPLVLVIVAIAGVLAKLTRGGDG